MTDTKQTILTISAKALFDYFPKQPSENNQCFKLDFSSTLHTHVVMLENTREDCPLFHQIYEILKERQGDSFELTSKTLYDKFLIVDFKDIFLSMDSDSTPRWKQKEQEFLLRDAQDLIEHGFDLRFSDSCRTVHMSAFDKSGNMSRHSRISFVDATLYDELNLRLNLGIDFFKNKIKAVESKYYAYRGLYLSSSKRVTSKKLLFTPETVVILQDERLTSKKPASEKKPVTGYNYESNVPLIKGEITETSDSGKTIDCKFSELEKVDLLYVDTPFDGSGFITPTYAQYINHSLKLSGATSFQIRLPFVKGMLHEVDVHDFFNKYNSDKSSSTNWYTDAFGIKRDLRKAHIFITKSMFKAYDWLMQYLKLMSKDGKNLDVDPMEFYCNAMKKYDHALYVSSTNLPYGHSKYTHLSYQLINTLDFSKDQFEHIVNRHCNFIKAPVEYLKSCDEMDARNLSSDEDIDDSDEAENIFAFDTEQDTSTWKQALFKNPALKDDIYIKSQLQNVQKGLLTKLVTGKLLVEGQMRYLCRDLLPLLVSLLENEKDMTFFQRYLYGRFYLPMDEHRHLDRELGLNYLSYYAIFRNPHLSRNEQVIMQRFTDTDESHYIGYVGYEDFKEHIKLYDKYFGKLTGVVMVPRGSVAPLCLGGADFDGDLVNVIFNQDVVTAVASGCYEKNWYLHETLQQPRFYYTRKLPVIKIPTLKSQAVALTTHVPFEHIKNTFSNRIGQISNAAIAIGQNEYEKPLNASEQTETEDQTVKKEFDTVPASPSCALCTLLTGLEIDAAKNGKHPNLDSILKANTYVKNTYLYFLKNWKKLRAEEKSYFSNLSAKEYKSSTKNGFYIFAKGCQTKASFTFSDSGTYINKLPGRFRDELVKYQKQESSHDKNNISELFGVPTKSVPKNNATVREFKEQCSLILSVYSFYIHDFLFIIKAEKKENNYAFENLQRNLFQIYDEEKAVQLQRITLPSLKNKIQKYVTPDNTIVKMRERLLRVQWLLQPLEHRGNALESIIGNGFKESFLDETERELLFHFYQQGYKTLWLVLYLIEVPANNSSFDDLKLAATKLKENRKSKKQKTTNTKKKVPPAVPDPVFVQDLDTFTCDFYENNDANVQSRIYHRCLQELKEQIGCSDLDMEQCIAILHNLTKSNSEYRNFFWDAFTWEDIDSYLRGSDDIC